MRHTQAAGAPVLGITLGMQASRRQRESFLLPLLLVLLCMPGGLLAQTHTPVTTWHYDNGRSGANTAEVFLNKSNVNIQNFGKLFSQPLDGIVVGHPLYLPQVNIPGQGVHDVVYVATMHDTVYAFDANTLGPALWVTSILDHSPTGAATMSATLKNNVNPTAWSEMGIISTPVIDAGTGTIYVVAETYESPAVVHRLHALDVATGQEKLGGPVVIAGTSIQNGISTTFQDFYQMNRPGLLLVNGHVYIAWGSNGNNTLPCQGWVFSYNASTLQQEGVYTTEPGQTLGSIWQEGAGLSADSDGNIYAENGEGPYVAGINLSTSVIKLTQVGTNLLVADWFTPYSHQLLSKDDLDLTGGVLILDQPLGSFPHEAIAIGKQGIAYVINRDNMGQVCTNCTTTDTQILQEVPAGIESGTPVFWNNTLYFTGLGVPIEAFPMNFGTLGAPITAPTARGAGANAIITANGNTNGILWYLDGNHDLWALDAGTLTSLWVSGQAPNGRDALPTLAHFASPIAADGKVFVGTTNSLFVYGLFPALTAAGGGGQSGSLASTLPVPLKVQARDPYSSNVFAGVTVTFSDGAKGGVFNPTTAVTDASGFASTTYTLPTKAGTYTVTASATGYASGTFSETAVTNNGSATTTTLQSGSNPSTFGQAVTFTATIASTGGSIPNGETVTFKTGATVLGTGTLAGGVATFTTSTLPAGINPITASYAGDTAFAPSSGAVSQVVKNTTTTAVSSSSNPSAVGQAVTFTATITASTGSIPNGEIVTFKSGTTILGTGTVSGGIATFTTSTLPAGTDPITASYPGDTLLRSSYASLSQKVGSTNATTTTLHSGSNPSTVGQSVTFTATVSSTGGSIPNGETVTFKTGATVLGTGTLTGGAATFSISTLPEGTTPITAAYPGDTAFSASSGAVSQVVKNTTTTTVSSSVNPSNAGQAVTFTATVSSAGGSIPNGEIVTFKYGTTVLGTGPLSSGTATFTTSTLPGGTDSITASYPGDTNFRSSYSSVSQKVTKNVTTSTLSSSLNPSTVGQSVTFTARVTSTAGNIPDGESVTFKMGTTVLGTGTLTGGTATFTTSTLPFGTDTITASYAGDTNFATSSRALSQVVKLAAARAGFSGSPSGAEIQAAEGQ